MTASISDLSILTAALDNATAGLAEMVNSVPGVTLFVPDDNAINASLPLLANVTDMDGQVIFVNHIVPGVVSLPLLFSYR